MARKRKSPRTKNGKARRSQNAARPGANARRRRRKANGVEEDAQGALKASKSKRTRAEAGESGDEAHAAASAPDELIGALEEQVDPIADEGVTARQAKARAQRGPSRRSDSANTDDSPAKLIAKVLSLDEGTPEREKAMRELALHRRRHQPTPFMATPERAEAEKLVAQAERERKVKAINTVAEQLTKLSLSLEERIKMIDEVIVPILPDPVLGRAVWFAPFYSLDQADPEAWRGFCGRIVRSGAILAAMTPAACLEFGGAVQGILRCHLMYELGLSGAEVFALDAALDALRSACQLERQADRILASGSKRAASQYAQVMTAAAKARQTCAAEMNRLLERHAARRALPVVEAVVNEIEDRPAGAQLPDEAA